MVKYLHIKILLKYLIGILHVIMNVIISKYITNKKSSASTCSEVLQLYYCAKMCKEF